MRATGCCPHCGKPCAPYAECAARRAAKREQNRPDPYKRKPHQLKPDDPRRLPRGRQKFWKPEHDAILLHMLAMQIEPKLIAKTLKRTPSAITVRRIRLEKRKRKGSAASP